MDIFYPIQLLANYISQNPAINFFIYDTIKIGLLLVFINYLMAITRYYFPINKTRDLLSKRRWFGLDYLFAALLGVVTPFCSCSSIPLFIGFLSAGIPLGVTFAFLIASPLVNESSLILFPALFGWQTTIIYNVAGIILAVVGGIIIQKLHLEKYVNQQLLKYKCRCDVEAENGGQKIKLKKLIGYWWTDGFKITKNIFPYVILGVGIGALIHGFVPQTLIETYLNIKEWWVVPIATLLGVPLYTNSVTVIPIIEAFINKGVPIGTALAFMTATVALSLPEALILKKTMKWQLLVMFFSITTIGIMFIGYLFNLIQHPSKEKITPVNQPVAFAQTIKTSLPSGSEKIEVFVFHNTNRCISCINIGKYTKAVIEEKFPEYLKSGKIIFKEVNIDLPQNFKMAQEYKVSGSALFINAVKDGKYNHEEDTTVWRLVTNEAQLKSYFETKLKALL
ncbi:MAG: nitrophenyl compound nitroreductase subunit ArsF family protein [Candidatus Shapirobacteria bacterium]|nr:nitrophenyl compound nitroreductase subunit ArsF family protein [Candidatus Shapirobacteria bacterium]